MHIAFPYTAGLRETTEIFRATMQAVSPSETSSGDAGDFHNVRFATGIEGCLLYIAIV
jgi:hypothetical protein